MVARVDVLPYHASIRGGLKALDFSAAGDGSGPWAYTYAFVDKSGTVLQFNTDGSIQVAGLAKTALPTAKNDGDFVTALMDKFGRQIVVPITMRDLVLTQFTSPITDTTETAILSQVAGVFLDLVALIVTNTHATTDVRIDFRDTTGGSVRFPYMAKASTTVGFVLPVPHPQASVNTNWTAKCAASVADIRILAIAAQNK